MTTFPFAEKLGDGSDVKFRLYARGDFDNIWAFFKKLSDVDMLTFKNNLKRRAVMEKWVRRILNDEKTAIIAELGDEIAGVATLTPSDDEWTEHTAQIRLAVAHEHRGKGLAQLLAKQAFRLASERGIERLDTSIPAGAVGRRAALEHFGFSKTGEFKGYIRDDRNHEADIILMSYDVSKAWDQYKDFSFFSDIRRDIKA